MNGNSRHNHHNHHKHQPRPSQRRRVRRRQQITAILAVVGITLFVLVTVFLIIGARMHKKSVALRSRENVEESEVIPPETPETPSIVAYPLDRTSPSLSIATLAKQGRSAASLALNQKNGNLLYGKATVKAIAAEAKENGIYLSGVFTLSSLSEEDDLVRYELLSDDCIALAEALRAGVNEVMLLVPDFSQSHTEELKALLSDLRRLVPDACVGLALPQEFLSEENAASIDDLAGHFSLLAVDLSSSSNVDADVEADLYDLLRYSMRVLLPSASSEDEQKAMLASVTSHSINNIQILP